MYAPDTEIMMDLVEQKTGYRVSINIDDKIVYPSNMVSARAALPMHVINVNPKYAKYGNYLVANQCAMLLIKWGDPERVPDFTVSRTKLTNLERKFAKRIPTKDIPLDRARQHARFLVERVLGQLNSAPAEIISVEIVSKLCPGLGELQKDYVSSTIRESYANFTRPGYEFTPKKIFDRVAVMNAAFAVHWSEISGDTTVLLPYSSLGYLERGEKLLKIYKGLSMKTDPDRYIETVDAWAKELDMSTWYKWHFRKEK